ncbi:16S rRNA (guanine527-N7)-methyltransferase [Williamsoniiplasma luminosum]|uniref:Ribosomal RNA small subunit methyltransferase G n=1 Tax=Williamsoniiplasma luminosum TaxID=214888 RepID=A0A2K8NT56_9MOLU|nr:16S rRNA (guanine(527)-N(7))-methyltransferase RsmG [Williamsoniiplasma luminosum]ATZ16944.1 16S rRNA (guanine527-N7)-methyltransferase [Williamsoniiplasma luminosum]
MFNNWKIFDEYKNLKLTDVIKTQLNQYYDFLVSENEKYNLTRITSENEVFEKHFLDSLLFTQEINLENQTIADIGTGPGFPGVVLKIFFPNLKITLIESNNKKVLFLKQLINLLNLKDIDVVDQRAEVFSIEHQEEFDLVISRAVAYLDIILEIGVQMLKIDGYFVLLKGPKAEEEIKNMGNKDQKMKLELVQKQVLVDVGFGSRTNLFYQKKAKTPKEYPRKYAQIKKDSKQN